MTCGSAVSGIYNQTATYWPTPVLDGYGTRSFAAPILIKVRWEDRTGLMIYKDGEEINSRAVIYPDRALNIGGYLIQGDHTSTIDPQTLSTAYMIQDYKEVPSVSGRKVLRKAML